MRLRLRSPRGEAGAAAVEFALVVPFLVMLLLGVTTAGICFNTGLGTVDAVRAGARYGATLPVTPTPAPSWAGAIQQRTVDLSYGAVQNTSQVCVELDKGPTAAPTVMQSSGSCSFATAAPALPAGVAATDCVVRVWAQIPVTFTIGVATWNINIVRGAVTRYERTGCP